MSDFDRGKFEQWAQFDLMAHDFEQGEHGEYLDDFLQQSWLGWQARSEGGDIRSDKSHPFVILMRDITEQDRADPDHERAVVVDYDWLYERIERTFKDASAHGGEAEPVAFVPASDLNNLKAGHPAKIYPLSATPSPFESSTFVYTQAPAPTQGVPDWLNRLNSCEFHDDDHEACAKYSGQVPCSSAHPQPTTGGVPNTEAIRLARKWLSVITTGGHLHYGDVTKIAKALLSATPQPEQLDRAGIFGSDLLCEVCETESKIIGEDWCYGCREEFYNIVRDKSPQPEAGAGEVQDVANKVCGQAPEGWIISLCMENGAAWVEAEDPDGDEVQFTDHGDMTLIEQINDALCFAKGWIEPPKDNPPEEREGN